MRRCNFSIYMCVCVRCIQVGSDITFILQLSLASREPCAATAVGVAKVHQEEAKKLLLDTFPNYHH